MLHNSSSLKLQASRARKGPEPISWDTKVREHCDIVIDLVVYYLGRGVKMAKVVEGTTSRYRLLKIPIKRVADEDISRRFGVFPSAVAASGLAITAADAGDLFRRSLQ